MTYGCKTYKGQNKQYLKRVSYETLKDVFNHEVNFEFAFRDIRDYLDKKYPDVLKECIIEILSNPNNWTIAELQEVCNYEGI